jgi:hypothetical protein
MAHCLLLCICTSPKVSSLLIILVVSALAAGLRAARRCSLCTAFISNLRENIYKWERSAESERPTSGLHSNSPKPMVAMAGVSSPKSSAYLLQRLPSLPVLRDYNSRMLRGATLRAPLEAGLLMRVGDRRAE